MRNTIILLLSALVLCHALPADPNPQLRTLTQEALVRMRCSLCDAQETYYFFNGSVFSFVPAQSGVAPSVRTLFKTVGGNVGRCFKRPDGSYTLASREFLYYIDPVTDNIVNSWTNPWNNKTVTVMHVDNDPVLQQYPISSTAPFLVMGDETVMFVDVPLQYPNPLGNNPTYADYSPQAMYQAGEFFKFVSPTADVFNSSLDTVSSSFVSWTRTGPWLPWMAMGNISGYLMYSSQGNRVANYSAFPDQVRNDLVNRVPQYLAAPACVPNTTSVTSWTFFRNNFQSYLNGVQFPLAAAANYNCVPDGVVATTCRAIPALRTCVNGPLPTPTPPVCPSTTGLSTSSSSLVSSNGIWATLTSFAVAILRR